MRWTAPATTTTSPRSRNRRTVRRPRRGGPAANPRPPPGSRRPAPVSPNCQNGFRCPRRTCSPPRWCAACAGTGNRPTTPKRRSRTFCADAQARPVAARTRRPRAHRCALGYPCAVTRSMWASEVGQHRVGCLDLGPVADSVVEHHHVGIGDDLEVALRHVPPEFGSTGPSISRIGTDVCRIARTHRLRWA